MAYETPKLEVLGELSLTTLSNSDGAINNDSNPPNPGIGSDSRDDL